MPGNKNVHSTGGGGTAEIWMEKLVYKGLWLGIWLTILLGMAMPVFHRQQDIGIGLAKEKLFNPWKVSVGDKEYRDVNLPAKLEVPAGEKVVYSRYLPKMYPDRLTLMFFSVRQQVRVYVDGYMVYSRGVNEGTLIGKTPGSFWNMISIAHQYAGKELKIELYSPHKSYNGLAREVLLGSKASCFVHILERNLLEVLLGCVIMILGLGAAVVHFTSGREKMDDHRLVYLSVFAISIGLWMASNSTLLQFITGNTYIITRGPFIALLFLLPVTVSFIKTGTELQGRHYLHILEILSVVNMLLCLALDATGISDLMSLLPSTHVLLVSILLYVPWVLGRDWLLYKNKEAAGQLAAFLVLGLAAILELLAYYQQSFSNLTGSLNLILPIFIVLMGRKAFLDSLQSGMLRLERNFYKDLATKDTLTGGQNRTAYDHRLKELMDQEAYIVIIDLNDLKKINDHYGHDFGDFAIQETYRLMEENWRRQGDCYRIGGDEFAVLLTGCPEEWVLGSMRRFEASMEEAAASKEFPFSAAAGMSHFEPRKGESIYKAIKRADEAMYVQKQEKKRQRQSVEA